MTEQSEHLSNAQIENYGNRTSGAGPEAAQRDERQRAVDQPVDHRNDVQRSADLFLQDQRLDDQRVEAHLADCPSCRNRVLDFHRHHFALLSEPAPDARPTVSALADSNFANPKYPADPQVRTVPTPECPSDDTLRQLAAGLTSDDAAAKLIQHAATCDHCGPLLRSFTGDFSDDFTEEEQAALANLKSSSVAWQKNTAQKMLDAGGVQASAGPAAEQSSLQKSCAKATTDRKPFFWKWALAFSFVLLLAAGASWLYPVLALYKESRAVDAEYRKGRPMKYRPAEVPYGPYDSERGSRDNRDSATEIKPNPDKAPVLAANAAFLMRDPDGYTNAKLILKKALLHDSSPPLLNNLAVAYAIEADNMKPANEEEQRRQDDLYLKALETLGPKVSDPAALFNQALILEHLHQKQKAIEALEKTLEKLGGIEQDPWRKEAADKLALLRSLP